MAKNEDVCNESAALLHLLSELVHCAGPMQIDQEQPRYGNGVAMAMVPHVALANVVVQRPPYWLPATAPCHPSTRVHFC